MRRALAIGFAVILIGLALLVRSRRDAGEADREAEANRPSGTLVCATELRPVCEQLRADNPTLTVRVEEAGITYATLTKASFDPAAAKIDAWLVPQPWPAMVDEARQAASQPTALDPASKVIGRSPIVLVGWNDRLDALRTTCPNRVVDWNCIGDVAGRSWSEVGGQAAWGNVKPGIAGADSTTGVFSFAQGTGQFLGTPNYAANDLADGDYRIWAANLGQAATAAGVSTGSPLDQMLAVGRSSFDVAGSLEALAAGPVTMGRDKSNLTILYPAPAASADVVLAPMRGSQPGGRVKQLLESNAGATALARNGWRVDGQPTTDGVRADQPLPATGNGLPRAGVLQAVRDTWSEARR